MSFLPKNKICRLFVILFSVLIMIFFIGIAMEWTHHYRRMNGNSELEEFRRSHENDAMIAFPNFRRFYGTTADWHLAGVIYQKEINENEFKNWMKLQRWNGNVVFHRINLENESK